MNPLLLRSRKTLESFVADCRVAWTVSKAIASHLFKVAKFVLVGLLLVAFGIAIFEQVFPERSIEVSYLSWIRSTHGHLELLSVKIKNNHDSKLKDFVIACDAIGNSGTTIETVKAKTLYESPNPHGELTIPTLDLGLISDQTSTIRCRASDASNARK